MAPKLTTKKLTKSRFDRPLVEDRAEKSRNQSAEQAAGSESCWRDVAGFFSLCVWLSAARHLVMEYFAPRTKDRS